MSGHLVHGMGTGLEAPAWPRITLAEARAVLAHYPDAGAPLALEWHSPRPFSAACLARTTTATLFLKRHAAALRSPAVLASEHAFIAHLAAAGLPVARVLATASGASALSLGGATWEVHQQAPGADLYRDRQSWTPYLTPAHAYAAGQMLARLHRAAQGFAAPARHAAPLVASSTILAAPDPLAAARTYVAARPALAGYLGARDWQGALAARLARHGAGALAPQLAALPPLWTHNDWHPSNLLWDGAGAVASVLDFGLSDRCFALYDLATALERCAVRWLELGSTDDAALVEAEAARALLAGYGAICPLGVGERALLAGLLPLVHIEFALAEVDYFHGLLGRPQDATLAWEGFALGHADWFARPAGQALLALIAHAAGDAG